MKTDTPPPAKSDPSEPSQPAPGTDSPQPAVPTRDRIDEAPESSSERDAIGSFQPPAPAPGGPQPELARPQHAADGPAFPANTPTVPNPSPTPEGQGTVPAATAQPEPLDQAASQDAASSPSPSPDAREAGRWAASSSLAAGRDAGDRQRAQEEELAALLDGVVRGQERMLGVLNRAVDSLAGFQARLDALESRLRDMDLRHQSIRNAGYGST
jgi:hypothetical protein